MYINKAKEQDARAAEGAVQIRFTSNNQKTLVSHDAEATTTSIRILNVESTVEVARGRIQVRAENDVM